MWSDADSEPGLAPKKLVEGLSQEPMVEYSVILSALGVQCINDMQCLRQDKGLPVMLGYTLTAPEAGRQWLDKFHDEGQRVKRTLQDSYHQ